MTDRRGRPSRRRTTSPAAISLPVLESGIACVPRRSRIAKWRALALILLHVLIVIHLVHWLIYGWTLSPVVMSNAMYTLELGQINPAFIFFIALILSTLIVGRFFCGWACHMAALQDLCLWLLRRVGLRPTPFRARLLPYIPVAVAAYMFIWPSFKRIALVPLFSASWPDGLRHLGHGSHMQPFPGWNTQWTTTELWAGLPGAWVAIPFLVVCGFATVYFLGARGFCNYGCPYGGFFIPAEKLALARVTVDPSKCDECGHCTAACTSGVRVLEELRAYGSVVDSRCMKSMDCVSVCPQGAIKLRFTKPAAIASGSMKRTFHTTLREELLLLGVFVFALFAVRGLYDAVPFLFAVGIAACVMFIAWKLLRMAPGGDSNVRLHGLQFKRGGRFQPAGVLFLCVAALGAAVLFQSAAVQYHGWRGGLFDDEVAVPREVIFAGAFHLVPDEMVRNAGQALAHYERAGSWRRTPGSGLGLAETPTIDMRAAWLHLVRGELREAEQAMERVIAREGRRDMLCAELARIKLLQDDLPAAINTLEEALAARPKLDEVRRMLAMLYTHVGRADEANALREGRGLMSEVRGQ
jgi:polyferredoxin